MKRSILNHLSVLGVVLSTLGLAACENHAGTSGSLSTTSAGSAPREPATQNVQTASSKPNTTGNSTSTPGTPMTTSNASSNPDTAPALQSAMFGAGCFWQVEEVFRKVPGVISTAVGYSGGQTKSPTYRDVCTDATGHAEVLHIEFDPKVVTYDQLLDVFWNNHNPTTMNRQGPDVGTQYRSAIFYYSPEQKAAAEESKKRLDASKKWKKPVVTQIEPAGDFYRAEDYHQRYLQKRGIEACHVVEEDDG